MPSNQTTPEQQLRTQTRAMIAFWQAETTALHGENLIKLDKERFNLFHAIQKGLQLLPQETAPLILQVLPLIDRRGYWKEWLVLLQEALHTDQPYPVPIQISLMAHLGKTYLLNDQTQQAIHIHLQAKEMAYASEQKELLATICHDLLEDYLKAHDYNEAKKAGKQAISLYDECHLTGKGLANSYKMLGLVYYQTGQQEQAEKHLIHAVALWRELNNPLYLARTLNDLGNTLHETKRFEVAEDAFSEASFLLDSTINEFDKCMVQINLGSLYASQQNWQAAESAFQTANSPYLRQSINFPLKAKVNNNLGYISFKQEHFDAAKDYLQQAVSIWDQVQDEINKANTLSTLGDVWMAQGKIQDALPIYEEVVTTLSKYPQNAFAARLCSQYAEILSALKENQPTCM